MNDWIKRGRNSALLSFVLLALVGGWAIHASAESATDQLYKEQLAACERGNLLIRESNHRINAHRTDTSVLRGFLLDAAQARQAAYEANHETTDLKASRAYLAGAQRLEAVKFDPLPPVNCNKVIKKP